MDFIYNYIGWGTMALELALGFVFVVHGWAKVRNPGMMAGVYGKNKALGMLHGWIEVGAGIAVATGFGTFYGTLAMIVIMVGAIYYKIAKWNVPFSSQNSTGWEFDLVLLAGALALLLG
jgi:putative oxidoreductase